MERSATRNRAGNRGPGFTILELAISMAVFIIVVALSASLLSTMTGFYTEALARSDLMQTGKIAQEEVFGRLFSAKIISLAGAGTTDPVLTFVAPVELPDGAGGSDFVDANGEILWGAVEAEGPRLDLPGDPHRTVLRAAASGTVTESAANLDLNNDGDHGDTFQIGSISTVTSGGLRRELLPERIVIGQTGRGIFDIDGDGVPDPWIRLGGESFTDSNGNGIHDPGEPFVDANGNERWDGSITISFLVFSSDRRGQGHRFVYRSTIRLAHNH